jgi:hypothetical protein
VKPMDVLVGLAIAVGALVLLHLATGARTHTD